MATFFRDQVLCACYTLSSTPDFNTNPRIRWWTEYQGRTIHIGLQSSRRSRYRPGRCTARAVHCVYLAGTTELVSRGVYPELMGWLWEIVSRPDGGYIEGCLRLLGLEASRAVRLLDAATTHTSVELSMHDSLVVIIYECSGIGISLVCSRFLTVYSSS